ncbi:hypothetical protein VNO78_20811 [Psophocarpus tetragonolobus]|uniref:Uncharacterized protein n=1 Tax=Psophocarpus tetragonolobus TaxID=3891 RepID=A0AAN9SC36_PSOTE
MSVCWGWFSLHMQCRESSSPSPTCFIQYSMVTVTSWMIDCVPKAEKSLECYSFRYIISTESTLKSLLTQSSSQG